MIFCPFSEAVQKHPDILKTKSELEALEKTVAELKKKGAEEPGSSLMEQTAQASLNRATLRKSQAEQEIERLSYLEHLGLARKVSELRWELSPEHECELRRRQRSKDVIKSRALAQKREKGMELER